MIKGDTVEFKFKVKQNGVYVDGSQYSEVELQFNQHNSMFQLRKLKSKDEISWDDANHLFVSPLSQQDTFSLNNGTCEVQVRLFKDEVCKATLIQNIDIGRVLSDKVIGEENE